MALEAKRRAISDLEEYRRRHLQDLQTNLAEQRAIYAPTHPIVVDLGRSVESLRHESPQVAALKQEETTLRQELLAYGDAADGTRSASSAIPPELFRNASEDSSVQYLRSQVIYATQQSAALRDRINAARIELDTARAAFKYRYQTVIPPQVPRGPIRPRALAILAAAFLAGLLLALFATTAADLRSGVIMERWQAEEALGRTTALVEVRFPWPGPGQPPST